MLGPHPQRLHGCDLHKLKRARLKPGLDDPVHNSAARSLSLVCEMISRRCASTITRLFERARLADDVGEDDRFAAAGRRDQDHAPDAALNLGIKRRDGIVLIWAQLDHVAHPSPSRALQSGTPTAADGRDDRAQAIIRDQAVALAGIDQTVSDGIAIKFSASDKLEQPEAREVERVVARAGHHRRQRRHLGIEGGEAVAHPL